MLTSSHESTHTPDLKVTRGDGLAAESTPRVAAATKNLSGPSPPRPFDTSVPLPVVTTKSHCWQFVNKLLLCADISAHDETRAVS